MKTKLQKLLIAIAGLLISANAFAYYDFNKDGIYYNILSETDRTVAVTYGSYGSYSGNVTIPTKIIYQSTTYSVTSIGDKAFYDCDGLTSVTIPNSVTSIGNYAFFYCGGLTSVTIPNSVTSIGDYAFRYCSGLTSVTIPNSVKTIGDCAFYYCGSLTSIKVETENSVYDSRNNCNAIIKTSTNTLILGCKNSTIPNSVTSIGANAFSGCDGLTSVTIPNSVTSIGDYAFDYCGGLTSVTIPNSVTSIGDYAFRFCDGLTSITIGNSVTSIGEGAFSGCDGLTSVTIPNSVTSIGANAFSGCVGLTSVTIPNSVTSIGDYAFRYCSSLTSVTIPNSVKTIGDYAFACSNIRTIYCQSTTPPTYNNGFYDDVLMYSTLYVPTGCKSAYEAVDPWRNFWNIEEMEFNGIEDIVADGDEINVIAQNGEIVVNGIENAMVEVYNIGGQLVYSGNSTAIAVANKGIYIVKVSGKTFKIAL